MNMTRVLSDKSILFQYHHDDANWVGVAGEFSNWEPWPMRRDENGVWALRTGSLPDGIYEYKFNVDGHWTNDQFNIRENFDRSNNIVKIGWGAGHLYKRHFYSDALGKHMPYSIYLPPSYFYGKENGYPTLYLQGGLMDGCQDWSLKGNLEYIMDDMIGRGEICEMIVVCNEKDDACFAPEDWSRYASYLSEDLVNHIESEYNVSTHPLHRGIDGLSLGAGWSLRLGANRPDFYTSVGALSGSASEDVYHTIINNLETIYNYGTSFQQVVGYAEGDIVPASKHFDSFLDSKHVPSTIYLREGDHDWPLWKEGLTINLNFHSRNFNRG